jgi:hypothetical protein
LSTLSDPHELEALLQPHVAIVNQIQAAVFFKNPPAFVIPLLLVNLLFWIIYKLNLGVIPTVFLLLTLKILIELAFRAFARPLAAIFAKHIDNPDEGPYRIYPLHEVCLFLSKIGRAANFVISVLKPQGSDIASSALLLMAAGGLALLFLITGTFWVNFVIVNLAFFVPAIAFHPAVKPLIAGAFTRKKPKAE